MSDSALADSSILVLARGFAPGLPADAPSAREANLPDAGLTSMASVKLMLAIEAAYDVAIPDKELTPENFRSVAAIEALVVRLRGG